MIAAAASLLAGPSPEPAGIFFFKVIFISAELPVLFSRSSQAW